MHTPFTRPGVSVYHLVERTTEAKVVVVFEARSINVAISTAEMLDPSGKLMMLHVHPKHDHYVGARRSSGHIVVYGGG